MFEHVTSVAPCLCCLHVQVDPRASIRVGRLWDLLTSLNPLFQPPFLCSPISQETDRQRGVLHTWIFFAAMPSLHVTRVSAAVWKWFCRCPETIGPLHDTSSDEEFFTPPTSPPPASQQQCVAVTVASATTSSTHGVPKMLSPSQTVRLRRRHAEAVRQLTTPAPVVPPSPHGPLKAYQRPLRVYRPSWAP